LANICTACCAIGGGQCQRPSCQRGGLPLFTDGLDAPEGGFGWYLIRAMASDLKYQRDAEQNLLTFQLEIDASSH
jgi:anti-sigma regulatory factor (Ser/Thr protein kinase)